MSETRRQLGSWQEIAEHLGVTVRTAQRWERELGLPVTREAGGRVRGEAGELERWRMGVQRRRGGWWERRKALAAWLGIALAALVVWGVLRWMERGPRRPGELQLSTDAAGRTLICRGERGEELWRFAAGRVVRDRRQAYSAEYKIARWAVLPDGRVSVAANHAEAGPAQVAALDARGRLAGEYWHSGRLTQLEVGDVDGDETPDLLLCGVNQGYQAATLVVLDSRRLSGASRQPPGDPHQLEGFAEAREKTRVLFPRTCINRALEARNEATQVRFYGNEVGLWVREKFGDEFFGVRYIFDLRLRLRRVDWPEPLKRLHAELERKGVLNHRLTEAEMNAMRELVVLRGPG